MWLSASWGKSTVFCLMNLLKPQLVSPLTPGESGIIRDANRSAFCLRERRGKHFLCAGTWANVMVFNINSLSSRTQLGHLCLTHSIGSEWIWIYGPMEGATGWITKWDILQAQQNGGCTTWQSGTDAVNPVWMYKKDETLSVLLVAQFLIHCQRQVVHLSELAYTQTHVLKSPHSFHVLEVWLLVNLGTTCTFHSFFTRQEMFKPWHWS